MDFKTSLIRRLSPLVAALFLATSLFLPAAQAGMVGTQVVVDQAQTEQQRAELKQFLDREDVRDQLVGWGVDPDQAKSRVDRLHGQELAHMSQRMQDLPAGASDVLGVLVFLFLVLLVTDILGFTDIFPFVKAQR